VNLIQNCATWLRIYTDSLENNLTDFDINATKIVFVTDRVANVLAAIQDSKHLSCCDHIINTVLTHLFDNKSLQECPSVKSMLTGSKGLVRYSKKSCQMRLLPSSLKQVSTMWNPIHLLLESVRKNTFCFG